MTLTKKGYELANRLRKAIDMSPPQFEDVVLTCSRLCKQQATLHRLAEIQCSVELDEREAKEVVRKEEIAENAVNRHVATLRQLTGLDMGVIFNGDPRGPAVKLTLPPEMRHVYDCAGGEGVCVP